MVREVASESTDSDGSTTVKYRVDDFTNFGLRMAEIEENYHKQRFGDAASDSDGLVGNNAESLTELESLADGMTQLLGGVFKEAVDAAGQAAAQLDQAELAEKTKTAYKDIASKMASSGSFDDFLNGLLDDCEDSDEDESEPDSQGDDDLQMLEVCFDNPLKWTPEVQKRLDGFLDSWPDLRPRVLIAMFEGYRMAYDEFWSFMGGTEADRIVLPLPTEPSVIEDLFRFTSIYLTAEDDAIGLAGHCTWDDEHGIGVRIETNGELEAGEADIAYV